MSWISAARTRLALFFAPRAAESRIDDEIRFHIDMETQQLMRSHQLDHAEARRRALASFGGAQQHRETLRDGRGTAWFSGLSLDLKLGVRMLAKYPGLALVGGLAMAFGIWFGAVTFRMVDTLTSTKLPLPDGDRIVRIQNWNLKTSNDDDRMLYDYQLWRSAKSITDLGAYRNASVNLVGADGTARTTVAAEISASAFRIAPARPVLGRALDESDERPGATPVVVLGHALWNERFARDPRIIGRTVQLGSRFATVVGVMPEGYAFPMAHELWLPLRTDVPGLEPGGGGDVNVFGRLANGMTFEGARSEFASFARRLAAARPADQAQIQTYVIPYAQFSANPSNEVGALMALMYAFVFALVVVVCSTVALLMFARAASREAEIVVRSALGASRWRIVTQLFAEALVLAGVAAVIGLAAAQFSLTRWGRLYLEVGLDGQVPFWYDFNVNPATILYALGLAVLSAIVAGVMPARKITRGLGTQLRAGTAGGGVSFGGVWTAVIVTQVALTVAFPAAVLLVRGEIRRIESYDAGFPTQQYLGVKVAVDGPPDETVTPEIAEAQAARFGASLEALRRRVETEPRVAGVTIVDQLPRDYHRYRRLEVVSLPGNPSFGVETASIHPSYFATLQAPMIAGRAFTAADQSPDARVVIVDKAFADRVMPGRNVIGHRVRISSGARLDSNSAELPWYEIVGVVKELGMAGVTEKNRPAGLYLPLVPGKDRALNMIVQAKGDPLTLAPRVRELATAVDPALRIEKMTPLDEVATPYLWFLGLWMKIMMGLTAVALLLSLSGIYAVLAYIVARRTREVGVRVALGATGRRVITSIFRRPLTQVTIGVLVGAVIIGLAAVGIQHTEEFRGVHPPGLSAGEIATIAGYAVLMLGVCTLACVVPTLRVLRVQPTEALRAE